MSYSLPCFLSSASCWFTCSGVGERSSLPNRPSSGQDRPFVNSIGEVGCFGLSSSLLITTRPPHSSTAASMFLVWQAKRKVCRPPEQVPHTPTLPLWVRFFRRQETAPSASALTSPQGRHPSPHSSVPTCPL